MKSASIKKTIIKFSLFFMALSVLTMSFIIKFIDLREFWVQVFLFPGVTIVLLPRLLYNYFTSGFFHTDPASAVSYGIFTIVFYTLLGALLGYTWSKLNQKYLS